MEKRRATPRFDVELPVGFSGARLEGIGVICNLSKSGARIREPTTSVPDRTILDLELGQLSDAQPFSVMAEVVRQTEDGLAVRFVEMDADTERLLGPFLEQITESRRGGRGRAPSKE